MKKKCFSACWSRSAWRRHSQIEKSAGTRGQAPMRILRRAQSPMPMPSSLQWNWRFDGYLRSSSDEPSYCVAIYDTKALRTLDLSLFSTAVKALQTTNSPSSMRSTTGAMTALLERLSGTRSILSGLTTEHSSA